MNAHNMLDSASTLNLTPMPKRIIIASHLSLNELEVNSLQERSTIPLYWGPITPERRAPDRTLSASFSALPPLNIFDPVYGAPQPDPSTLFPLFNEDDTTTDTENS